MSFQGLDQIFRVLTKQPEWESYRQYCHLVEIWQRVLADNRVSSQTKPLYVARQVLWVATSSSVWAQHLTMQRYQLLKDLNALLPEPLTDIRFSSARWYNAQAQGEANTTSLGQDVHPSYIGYLPERPGTNSSSVNGFLAWLDQRHWYSQHLPPCPQCQAPTPVGEIARWGVCALCAAGSFSGH